MKRKKQIRPNVRDSLSDSVGLRPLEFERRFISYNDRRLINLVEAGLRDGEPKKSDMLKSLHGLMKALEAGAYSLDTPPYLPMGAKLEVEPLGMIGLGAQLEADAIDAVKYALGGKK